MFKIYYRKEIPAAHKLNLSYESKCKRMHGHNYLIEVWITALKLNVSGMVVDFTKIKKAIKKYDHTTLNHKIVQPTAENLASCLADEINDEILIEVELQELRVRVWENRDSYAEVTVS